MADKNHNGSGAGVHEEIAGVIHKAAQLSANELTDADLAAINKHTLEPLAAEDVFTFKAVLCDNEVDRQFERFNLKALQDLQKLFLGKTVIKDHFHRADNQVARIYSTELDTTTKILKSGEPYTRLIAHCYMVKTASNADLITEIKAGIKKEGSVGCSVSGAICSICGTDNAKSYCRHWPGKSYEKEGGAQVCLFTLTGAKDAYEFSLVAVPAQRAAGVSKSYTGKTAYEPDETPAAAPEETETSKQADIEMLMRLRMREAQAKINENKN